MSAAAGHGVRFYGSDLLSGSMELECEQRPEAFTVQVMEQYGELWPVARGCRHGSPRRFRYIGTVDGEWIYVEEHGE